MAPLPLPILTLRFSSPSFLETILTDAGSPVYSTETYHNSTALSRCHPHHGLGLVASIRWPEHPKAGAAQVLMDGCLKSEDELLRRNVLNTSRKFHIPGHSHPLKWKRVQGVFQCTSSCGRLVAAYEPPILTARARLNIFTPSLSGLPSPSPAAGAGDVSPILVDYLIVTAILLLTHPDDWRGFAASPSMSTLVPSPMHSALPSPYEGPVVDIAPGWTPVSPITEAYDEEHQRPYDDREPTQRRVYDERTQQQQRPYDNRTQQPYPRSRPHTPPHAHAHAHAHHKAPVDVDTAPPTANITYEPPPPYEEIAWTVRVRAPRPRRT